MGRVENVRRNILWGIGGKMISILLPFVSRTILIYRFGVDYVGLGSLFTSLLNMLNFSELGIGSAIVYSMYEPIARGDNEKVCALLNLYKKCYRVIGLIVLVIGLAIVPFLDVLVAGDVPDGMSLEYLYLIYLANTVLGYFLFAYRSSLFSANQNLDITYKVQLVATVFLNVFQILVLIFTINYYFYSVILPLSTILTNLLYGIISIRKYPGLKSRGKVSKEEIHSIERNVGGLVFQKIGGIVLFSVDSLVISAFLGLTTLGIYNNYYYIVQAVVSFVGIIMSSLLPSIGNSLVLKSKEENYKGFQTQHFLLAWLLSWWSACLLCLMQPFIKLWVGEGNMLPFPMVILFFVYFFFHHINDLVGIYKDAAGLWWETKFIPLSAAVVNLILNILLVQILGLPGILISTIIALLFIYIPRDSKILFKKYFENDLSWHLYIKTIGIYFVKTCCVSCATFFLCSLFPDCNIIFFILKFTICAFVPHVFLLILNYKNQSFKEATVIFLNLIPSVILPYRVKEKIKRKLQNK